MIRVARNSPVEESMKPFIVGVFCTMAAALAGCSGQAPQNQTLAACMQGWWTDSVTSACAAACAGAKPNPECAQSDCVERGVVGYLPSNVRYEGRFSYSPTTGTYSSVATPFRGTYTVADPNVTFQPQGATFNMSCSTNQMLVNTFTTELRASSGLAASLDTVSKMDSWRGVAVMP